MLLCCFRQYRRQAVINQAIKELSVETESSFTQSNFDDADGSMFGSSISSKAPSELSAYGSSVSASNQHSGYGREDNASVEESAPTFVNFGSVDSFDNWGPHLVFFFIFFFLE